MGAKSAAGPLGVWEGRWQNSGGESGAGFLCLVRGADQKFTGSWTGDGVEGATVEGGVARWT